jgi:Pyridoxamine 5'-phosphate oxidase
VDPQEITEELEHPGARNLLASATLLRLAYNGSDGTPRVIPIGFYWNGEEIVVCTVATAPKVKALSSRPNVAMTIDVGDTPTEAIALLVRRLASVDIVNGVPDEYVAASTKVLGADEFTESSARSGRCTTRWHVSPSSRYGRGGAASVVGSDARLPLSGGGTWRTAHSSGRPGWCSGVDVIRWTRPQRFTAAFRVAVGCLGEYDWHLRAMLLCDMPRASRRRQAVCDPLRRMSATL